MIRFGNFELDATSGELRKDGVRLTLQTQPLQVLTALLERPGGVVTREELRQRLWPGDTFVDFEHGLNAAVKRLRDTLGDSADTPRYIETLPRRGYRFIGSVQAPDLAPPVPPLSPPRRRWWPLAAGGLAIAVAVVAAWLAHLARSTNTNAPVHIVPLTTMNGFEGGSLSPDGQQVAFDWSGDRQDNPDIYVAPTGSADRRRLTTDPGADQAPAWSHDGRQIAYIHSGLPGSPPWAARVRVTSPVGTADREVSEFPATVPATWSPDDRYIVAGRASRPDEHDPDAGIFLIPVLGGDVRRMTRPQPPETHSAPSFSPDGRRLVFIACEDATRTKCHLDVLDVDERFSPVSAPRPLPSQPLTWMIWGVTWSRDGASLVYGAFALSTAHLWRVAADGRTPPERIDIAGAGAVFPATGPGDRLTFSRFSNDSDIYRIESGGPAEAIARSTVFEGGVQFSADGRHIAFCSERAGDLIEVWVANADGSAPQQVSHGPAIAQCSPAWSPDGTRIAFDSQGPDGRYHVWTVNQDGGSPRQITTEPGDQTNPAWSQDGEWIYYSSKPAGERDFWRRDVWRARVATGDKQRMTDTGHAVMGRESLDGTTLYFQSQAPEGPLMARPLAGGAARPLIACVHGSALTITRSGLYYIQCQSQPGDGTLRRFDPAAHDDRAIATLKEYRFSGAPGAFDVSPDGRTILYEREVHTGADLMMIVGFK